MGVRGLAQYVEEDSEFLQSKREGVANAKAVHETISDLEYSLKLFQSMLSVMKSVAVEASGQVPYLQ
jgi:hypothetical protein